MQRESRWSLDVQVFSARPGEYDFGCFRDFVGGASSQ